MDKYTLTWHMRQCLVEGVCNGCAFGKLPFPQCRNQLAGQIEARLLNPGASGPHYGKMFKCGDCVHYDQGAPFCGECDKKNLFRYYKKREG